MVHHRNNSNDISAVLPATVSGPSGLWSFVAGRAAEIHFLPRKWMADSQHMRLFSSSLAHQLDSALWRRQFSRLNSSQLVST